MAGGLKVKISADAKPFSNGLARATKYLNRWASRLPGRMLRFGINAGRRFMSGMIRSIRTGATIAAGALTGGIAKSLAESGRFEKYEMQFEALLGTAEEAAKRMQTIRDIDLEVPFDITSIADASRILTVFTDNAFASTDALRMMADAAAVTPNEIKDVAFWYGRAYSMIQAGRPFGEAAMRLQEMGLLTGNARNELEKFSGVKTPEAIAKALEILNKEFLKFEGSAIKLSKTWTGLLSIFTSATKQTFAAVGDAMMPVAKVWLQEIIDKMKELRSNGTLTRWGQQIADTLVQVRAKIEELIPRAKELYNQLFTRAGRTQLVDQVTSMVLKGLDKLIPQIEAWLKRNEPELTNLGLAIGEIIGKSFIRGLEKTVESVPFIGNMLGFSLAPIKMLRDFSEGATDKFTDPKLGFLGRARGSDPTPMQQYRMSRRLEAQRAGYDPRAVQFGVGGVRRGTDQVVKVQIVKDDTMTEGGQ